MSASKKEDDANAPSCWICLEGDSDESGPLVRDCTCRGSMGYGHISCIFEYALDKTLDKKSGLFNNISVAAHCPQCKQSYQNRVGIDMADLFVAYAEENSLPEQSRLETLYLKLRSFQNINNVNLWTEKHEEDVRRTAFKVIVLVKQMKAKNGSKSYDTANGLSVREMEAYGTLGKFEMTKCLLGYNTEERAKRAIDYYTKSRDLCRDIGYTAGIRAAEGNLARAKVELEGAIRDEEKELLTCQKFYSEWIKEEGEGGTNTIKSGLKLAIALKGAFKSNEAEILLAELVAISKRVHGKKHKLTNMAEESLQTSKLRQVLVKNQDGQVGYFNVVQYVGGGWKRATVNGPMLKGKSHLDKGGCTFTLFMNTVEICPSTPVECYGLKNAQHLNGKRGDIKKLDKAKGRYEVVFYDKELKSCLVKPGNLRIVFELLQE